MFFGSVPEIHSFQYKPAHALSRRTSVFSRAAVQIAGPGCRATGISSAALRAVLLESFGRRRIGTTSGHPTGPGKWYLCWWDICPQHWELLEDEHSRLARCSPGRNWDGVNMDGGDMARLKPSKAW